MHFLSGTEHRQSPRGKIPDFYLCRIDVYFVHGKQHRIKLSEVRGPWSVLLFQHIESRGLLPSAAPTSLKSKITVGETEVSL